jgi:hypothetical protein
MDEHSEPRNHTTPLDPEKLLPGVSDETATVPEGALRIKRMLAEARERERTTVKNVRSVTLVIRGMTQELQFSENDTAGIVLGRADPRTGERPDVDLTPMGAAERGVSRKHARLNVQDEHLLLTDLESMNGTYVRGLRLAPNTPTMLRKGDQILLGRLAMEVNFE